MTGGNSQEGEGKMKNSERVNMGRAYHAICRERRFAKGRAAKSAALAKWEGARQVILAGGGESAAVLDMIWQDVAKAKW